MAKILESILYDVKSKNLSDSVAYTDCAANSAILFKIEGLSTRLDKIEGLTTRLDSIDQNVATVNHKIATIQSNNSSASLARNSAAPGSVEPAEQLSSACPHMCSALEYDVFGKITGVVPEINEEDPDSTEVQVKAEFCNLVLLKTSSDIFSRQKKWFLYPKIIEIDTKSLPSTEEVVSSIKSFSNNVKFGDGNVLQVGLCLHCFDSHKHHFLYMKYDSGLSELHVFYFQRRDDFGDYFEDLHGFVLEVADGLFDDFTHDDEDAEVRLTLLNNVKAQDKLRVKEEDSLELDREKEFGLLSDDDYIVRILANMKLFSDLKSTVPPTSYDRFETHLDNVSYVHYQPLKDYLELYQHVRQNSLNGQVGLKFSMYDIIYEMHIRCHLNTGVKEEAGNSLKFLQEHKDFGEFVVQ